MASPQTENGFVRIANEIWDELIRRDFKKRHKDIIQFIYRLSYGCRKKEAHIPMLKDFELCGVGQTNVTRELNYLVECRVLIWDKTNMIFSIAKDFERWQVNPVRGWDEEKFKKLLHLNIEKTTYQNDKSPPEKPRPKVTITYQNNKLRLIKTISLHLSKREVRSGSNPWRCRVKSGSKDSIKDSIKDIAVLQGAGSLEEPVPLKRVLDAFCELHGKLIIDVGAIENLSVNQLLAEKLTPEFIIQAMTAKFNEKRSKGQTVSTFKYYVDFIRDAWKELTSAPSGAAPGMSITESPVPSGPVALGQAPFPSRGQSPRPVPSGPTVPNVEETRKRNDETERLRKEKQERMRQHAT